MVSINAFQAFGTSSILVRRMEFLLDTFSFISINDYFASMSVVSALAACCVLFQLVSLSFCERFCLMSVTKLGLTELVAEVYKATLTQL